MSLRLTYGDITNEVSEYLGTGDIPVDRDLRKAHEIVNKGYRKFLFPRNSDNGNRHKWSFLSKQANMQILQGQYIYQLPSDFEDISVGFVYSTNDNFNYLTSISHKAMLQKRVLSDSQGFPDCYSIVQDNYNKEQGNQKEVWFYCTPSQTYNLNYVYHFIPPELTNSEELFVGGEWYDEAILACCLSVAEIKHKKELGVMYQNANIVLQHAISADQTTRPDTVGLNINSANYTIGHKRYLNPISQNDVYN